MFRKSTKKNILVSLSVWIAVIFLFPQNYAGASSLTGLSDKMSRHAPSIPADHEIKFTAPSGAGNIGDYIRISFDGGFVLSGVIFSDVTLSHGPVTGLETMETVAAAPSLTSWGLVVSSNRIDLIHPTNAANGDIAPNDKIVIRIGNINKITNPAIIGSKIISLAIYNGGNTLIDSGKLAVAIFQDQIGIGGETGLVPPNPVILNFPYNVTQISMDIDWSENIDFDFDRYELYMSESPGVTNMTGTLLISISDPAQTIFNISGLAPGRRYYFVVYVYDDDGLSAASNEVNAQTSSGGGGGVTPPPPPPPPEEEEEEEEFPIFEKIGDVFCEEGRCAYFTDNALFSGMRPINTEIYINNSTDGVNYPALDRWSYLATLHLGENIYEIYAKDAYGQISNELIINIKRYEVGDSNGDFAVDDFDLSMLVAHFGEPWCFSDFNMDNIVDDFDLSALAFHWGFVD